MRVLFIVEAVVHYHNHLFNRLSNYPGIEVVVVAPRKRSADGDGVYQLREGLHCRVHALEECMGTDGGLVYRGLWRVLFWERPDVVVVTPPQFRGVMRSPLVRALMRMLGQSLVLKSHPFRQLSADELRATIEADQRAILARPSRWPGVVARTVRVWRLRQFARQRWTQAQELASVPKAHVNYVEDAHRVYGSFGVPRERIFISRNAPDTDTLIETHGLLEASVAAQAEPHRVIHVGRLVQWKRVDLLLEAVALLRPEFPDIAAEIVGDGPEREALEKLAGKLCVGDIVQWSGGVYDPKDLGRRLMRASVYVLAGMGGVSINEAMCFARPVICSVCDGTEKFLVREGENGWYFREGDAGDLARAIRAAFADSERTAAMGERSREIIVKECNAATVASVWMEALEYVTR